jgi:hypothetical protein
LVTVAFAIELIEVTPGGKPASGHIHAQGGLVEHTYCATPSVGIKLAKLSKFTHFV